MDTMIPWPHHEDGIGLIKYRQQQLPPPPSAAAVLPPPASAAPARKARPQKDKALHCPRCNSNNTKFCYYNNYSLTQPRYFCKTCRRYWTEGGTLRNVPVGGGSRKNKKHSSSSASTSGTPRTSLPQQQLPLQPTVGNPRVLGGHLGCSSTGLVPAWPLASSPLEPAQGAMGDAGDAFAPPSGCYDYAQPGVFSFQDMMICSSKMPGGDQRGDLAHGGMWNW